MWYDGTNQDAVQAEFEDLIYRPKQGEQIYINLGSGHYKFIEPNTHITLEGDKLILS